MKDKSHIPPISSRPKKKPSKIDLGKAYVESLLNLNVAVKPKKNKELTPAQYERYKQILKPILKRKYKERLMRRLLEAGIIPRKKSRTPKVVSLSEWRENRTRTPSKPNR